MLHFVVNHIQAEKGHHLVNVSLHPVMLNTLLPSHGFSMRCAEDHATDLHCIHIACGIYTFTVNLSFLACLPACLLACFFCPSYRFCIVHACYVFPHVYTCHRVVYKSCWTNASASKSVPNPNIIRNAMFCTTRQMLQPSTCCFSSGGVSSNGGLASWTPRG